MTTLYEKALEAAQFLSLQVDRTPDALVILGSGLGIFADALEGAKHVAYHAVPHFPVSTVEGHRGQFAIGYCGDALVLVMQGRFHYYEGYDLDLVTLPIRVAKLMGIQRMVVTNSAGGLNADFQPGDLMLIEDHINGLGANPLRGHNDSRFGHRFPDMTNAYDPLYRKIAMEESEKMGMRLQSGVYIALSGPCFETPAEIRMFQRLGVDAAGMSTVPEVIVARHMGMRVLGMSCISNLAAGTTGEPLNHEEVLETGLLVSKKFTELLQRTIPRICQEG